DFEYSRWLSSAPPGEEVVISGMSANHMDPMTRILLETAVEALIDAGMNPSELEGSRTGVFAGACCSDMKKTILVCVKEPQKFGLTG
ncbi:unnamed protein product, partial [Tenebrio molitor]